MKLATGYLGWAPGVALAADPIMIDLAWKGWCQQREEYERMLYGAQGIRLPPIPPDDDDGMADLPMTTKWRMITRDHNARWSQKERARQRAKTRALPPPIRKTP